MSNLHEINELLHKFFEEYLKWILSAVFFLFIVFNYTGSFKNYCVTHTFL